MSNKDEFDRIAASVLEKLDETFPVPVRVYAKDYVDAENEEARMVFVYTVAFLAKEGLLLFESGDDQGYQLDLVVLTGRGLSLLNSVPEILQEKVEVVTFGQKIKKAVKAGSKEALKTAMNQLIQAAIKNQWYLPS